MRAALALAVLVTTAGCGGDATGAPTATASSPGAPLARTSAPRTSAPRTAAPTLSPRAAPPKQPLRPLRVTFVGDSIGHRGSFASTPARSWIGRVLGVLGRDRRVVTGRYATTPNADGNTVVAGIGALPPRDDVVFVMVGTTDVNLHVPWATFDRSYAALLTRARATSPSARLVCLGVWRPPDADSRRADAVAGAHCRRRGGTFVSVRDLYAVPSNRLPRGQAAFGGYRTDGVHPDDDGHAAIARRLRGAVDLRALALRP